MSFAPMTFFSNRKFMMLAGLTLSTTVTCSEVNLFFNTSFDSEQYILKHLLQCATVVRTCKKNKLNNREKVCQLH